MKNTTVSEAIDAGYAWAEGEADALLGPPKGLWKGTYIEALPLVDHRDPTLRQELA